jgi:hypothetical protein
MVDTTVRVFSKHTGLPLVQQEGSPSIPVDYDLQKSKYKSPDGYLSVEVSAGRSYRFSVTDEDFFSVLSIVDAENALLLLSNGVASSEKAKELLKSKELDSLIRDYTKLSEAAVDSGLSPLHFIELMSSMKPNDRLSLNAADAVRTYALEKSETPDLWYYSSMAQNVLTGDARYEDIKSIGPALLRRHFDLEGLSARLADLAWSNTPLDYDSSHLLGAIKRRMKSGMSTEVGDSLLTLMAHYGGDEALKLKNPVQLRHAIYSDTTKEEVLASFPYADEVFDLVPDAEVSFTSLVNMRGNGIPVNDVTDGLKAGYKASQIIAIHAGVEPALTEGWL